MSTNACIFVAAESVDDATLSSRLSDAVVVRVAPSGAQQGQSK